MKHTISHILKRLLTSARAFWPHITAIFLLNLLLAPLALLAPVPLKIVVDSAFGTHPLPGFVQVFLPTSFENSFGNILLLAVALVLITAFLHQLHGIINWVLKAYTGEKLVLTFRSILFHHVQRLSLLYHDTKGSADALYRIQYDSSEIRNLLVNGLTPIVSAVFTLAAMFYVMFAINWQFALIALAIVPPLVILTRISSARLRGHWEKVKEYESSAMSVMQEVLTSLRVVKAFGQEEREKNRFVERSEKAVKGQMAVAWTGAGFYSLVGMLMAVGTASFLYFGAIYVKAGTITVGELIIVMAYLAQIFGPLEAISESINGIQSSLASTERIFALLDKEPDVTERPHAIPVARANGAVTFEQVTFSYRPNLTAALRDISFSVKPGQRVGILGTTGSGKSTLINLLTRLYDPKSGRILLDGTDIRDYKLADYRSLFGIVLQEPVLFSTSIAENIAYGRPNAGMKEIIAAAKAANAHDFIASCKDGYKTLVGERGMQLSGGERQRISLARAFIKDAPLLILDEPTSSVDVGTEANIMEAMGRLMEGRTTFLITHRLDTLGNCDLLIHLEKGKLVEIMDEHEPELLEEKITGYKFKTLRN